jgi:hypothetical protein
MSIDLYADKPIDEWPGAGVPISVKAYADGGIVLGPEWKSVGYIGGGPLGPYTVPYSLCGNCRRDRHEYPLTQVVADMWESVAFDEDYDPDTDVSRIVCPGSDVCGPARTFDRHGAYGGYYTNTIYSFTLSTDVSAQKCWDSFNVDLGKLPSFPSWNLSSESGWTIDAIQQLKDQWTYKPAAQGAPWVVFHDEAYAFKQEHVGEWIDDFAPVSQAALEAAPKAIEMAHKVPEPPGYDFSGWNGKPALYTYMKRKKK